MAVKAQAQIGLEENVERDPELEEALNERYELEEGVTLYREADKKAKKMLEEANLTYPCRIGRFIVSERVTPQRSVSFEADASKSISIKLAGE